MTNGKRKALGRGLSALIPDAEGQDEAASETATAPTAALDPNP